jgi:anaerobic magnesium-protoporphyrin IX monomethyl ester cyclase
LTKQEEFRVLIAYPNLTMMLVPSIAIAILTSVLKKQSYQVTLFDTTHYVTDENSSPQNRVKFLQARQFDEANDLGVRNRTNLLGDFRHTIETFDPHLILFSVVEDCFRQTLSLLSVISDLDVPHLLGGIFPTAAPEVCLDNNLVKRLVVGEGEEVVVEFAEALRKGDRADDIPGVWSKQSDGTIKRGGRTNLVDINKVIPDFSLFNASRFNRPMGGRIFRTVPVETYRGCPFTCTFCNSPMHNASAKEAKLGAFLRRKTLSTLREEIRQLIRLYEPEFLYFIDDSFMARPKREILEFCSMYKEFSLPFWFNTRPETTTAETLKRLKDVGAYRISFGIESGNQQYRKNALDRRGTNGEIRRQFDVIAESGIPFSLNLLIGCPGETRDMVMDTVRFVRTISGFDTITVSIFTPYHGTKLREVAVRNGWLEKDYITKHTTSSSALDMVEPYLSFEMIDGLMRVIPLYVYFGEDKWADIEIAENDDDEGNRILAHYSDIYRRDFLGEDQESEKIFVEGATGCRSNRKDSLVVDFVSEDRLAKKELDLLMV